MRYTIKSKVFIFSLALSSPVLLEGCSRSNVSRVTTPPAAVEAGSVKLAWDGSFSAPGVLDPQVTGYRVYYGTATRDYSESVDVGLAYKAALDGLPRKTVFFAVTAYNAAGMESDFSDEVSADLSGTSKATLNMGK